MKRPAMALSAALVLVSLLIASCHPTSPSPPTPAPISTQAAPASAAPVAKSNPEDSTWQEVAAEAKKEASATIYSFGFTGDLGNAITAAFEKKYGIKLDLITGTGAQLVPRIQSEYRAGQNIADMLEGAPNNAVLARDTGLSQVYGSLPQVKDKDVFVVDPALDKQGHILAYNYSFYTIWINTKLLSSSEAPKSWKALLDPRWKGKIVVNDPDTMSIPNTEYVILTRYLGFSDDYFRDLGKQNLVFAPTQRESDSMVARGEYPILLTSSLVTAGPLITDGAPLAPVDMAEGVPIQRSPTIVLLAKAPHPNASRLFMNWFMSKEGQDVLGQARSTASIRKDVPDYSPSQARINVTKPVAATEDDTMAITKAQQDRILSKMWRTK